MSKWITIGNCNKRYFIIFGAISLLLLDKFTFGFIFDGEKEFEIKIFENGVFSEHYLIHQIIKYFSCILFSLGFIIYETIDKNKNLIKRVKALPALNFLHREKFSGFFDKDLNLIYMGYYFKSKIKYTKKFIAFILFSYVIIEQIKNIYKFFFFHMDFWMFELYIFAYFNHKILKIQIYSHQIVSFLIIFISIILKHTSVFLTMIEGKEEKALYAKYWWTYFIALVIYVLYSLYLSFTYINMKKIIDLKFISVNYLMLIYAIFGFLFCLLFCIIATYTNCENDDAKYFFKVKDEKNLTYIDNFFVYFESFKYNRGDEYKKILLQETLVLTFGGIFYAFYKILTLKIFEHLTPLHKIFSYPVYYFFQKFFLLIFKGYKLFSEAKEYFIYKLFSNLFANTFSIIGYLIYLEIIEINFCELDFNLRKNIIKRGEQDGSVIEDEIVLNEEDNSTISYEETELYD